MTLSKSHHENVLNICLRRKRGSSEMRTRSLIGEPITAFLLVLVMILIGNTAVAKPQDKSDSKNMNSSIVTTYNAETLAIPPIDAAAPSTFETASFGLG